MEMENRFKLRISSMFRSSFGSCRTRNILDVIEKPVFSPQNHKNFHLIEPLPMPPLSSPLKARPFRSICKPRCPESTQNAINHDFIMITPRETLPRRKVSARYPPFLVSAADFGSRKCSPASPISPLKLFADCKDFGFYERKKSSAKHKKKKKKNNKKKNKRIDLKSKNISSITTFFRSASQEIATNYNNNGEWWWFSSEDETEILSTSRTLSSDSSESLWQHSDHRIRCKTIRGRRAKYNKSCNMGKGRNNIKVKASFAAVVKSSSDPYNDFRTSMVEMIVERQMFAAKDLEQLLQCFLSLNSHRHHRIILEVFTEICETLFPNWS